ncbi:hypothetical protein INT47_009049 [Mucor saturninus]|uniref:Uncharacterized protein n=1 Tax=Mucor saturninus TaxID=64648 RepID=A0A8H7RPA9_9FUNG|nr:hypothetical protein INT47_009049 [Mucor saturninus]
MLDQEDSAWLTYTILFGLFSIALIIQSVFHWHITPFALYAICMAGGSLYMLIEGSNMLRPWRDTEPIINQIPVYSIFIFTGIVDWQFVYIRFISTTLKNHRRWGSLHPVIITEKGDATIMDATLIHPEHTTNTTDDEDNDAMLNVILGLPTFSSISYPSSFLFNARTFWIYVSAIILHMLVIMAFITCKIVISDPHVGSLASAILITIMALPAVLNTVAVVYTGSKCHSKLVSRIVGQNRRDATILFLIPILFTIIMSSTTVIAWLAYYTEPPWVTRPLGEDITAWVLVKTFSVYFPAAILLVCCMFKRRSYTNLVVEEEEKRTRRPSVNSLLTDRPYNKRHFMKTADY